MNATTNQYEIQGFAVEMTAEQAARWNAGDTTDADMDAIEVSIPEPVNQSRQINLRQAFAEFGENEFCGFPANRIG